MTDQREHIPAFYRGLVLIAAGRKVLSIGTVLLSIGASLAASSAQTPGSQPATVPTPMAAAPFHPSKDPDGHSSTSSNDGQFAAHNSTMAQLADALTQELSRELGRVVIDETGVQGRYDFALKWTPEARSLL